MAEAHYDRGNFYDNLSQTDFISEVSPDEAFLNPGRDFYDSDEEYFVALLSAEFDGPRYVRPDPMGEKVGLYEAPGTVVAIGEDIRLYSLRPDSHQINHVFDRMMTDLGGNAVREVDEVVFDEGVEEAVEEIFDMV
jgi:hypothetical protein